jgi:hypothetical protein
MLQTIARSMAVSGSNNMFMSRRRWSSSGSRTRRSRPGRVDKARVRRTLFEHACIPLDQIGQSNTDVLRVARELSR